MVVDVQRRLLSHGPFENGLDIRARAEWIMQIQLNRWYLDMADLVLVPDVKDVHWADFRRIDQLIEAGQIAAQEKEKEILRLFG
jgi:NTE family protein